MLFLFSTNNHRFCSFRRRLVDAASNLLLDPPRIHNLISYLIAFRYGLRLEGIMLGQIRVDELLPSYGYTILGSNTSIVISVLQIRTMINKFEKKNVSLNTSYASV